MRNAFINTLEKEVEKNKDIILLTGDLGFSVFDKFKKKYPNNFFNMGISEQNMIGVAAGLTLTGKKVFAYSIIPFVTFKCVEQIRNDLCYPNLDVVVVGVGSGFSYGPAGFSHHSLEDVGTLKTLPNLTILTPSDPLETKCLTQEVVNYKHPAYLRLGKNNEKVINEDSLNLKIGDINILKSGKDFALITHGNIIGEVYLSYEKLLKEGHNPSLISVPTIKPFNEKHMGKILKDHEKIIIVEELNKIGGLGDTIYSFNKNNNNLNKFLHLAAEDTFAREIGSSDYLRCRSGLDSESLFEKIKLFLKEKC